MASKRILKKEINYIAGELYTECLIAKYYIPETDQEKTDILISKVIELQNSFVRRANHPDGKSNPKLVKKYYKKLITDIDNSVEEIVEAIAALNK